MIRYIPLVIFHIDSDGQRKRFETLEPSYAMDIASMQGIETIKVDFSNVHPKHQLAFIQRCMVVGVAYGAKTYYLSFANASTKSKVVYLTTVKDLAQQVYEKPTDAIRFAVRYTPLHNFAGRVVAHVKIVDDRHPLVGDGMGRYNTAWAEKYGLEHVGHISMSNILNAMKADYRQMGFRASFECADAKGSIAPFTVNEAEDCDLLLPVSCVKGKRELIGTEFVAEFDFGIFSVAEPTEMRIGYQIAQYWPEHIWDLIRAEWPEMIAQMQADTQDPLTYATKFANAELRDRNGHVTDIGIMGAVAALCSVKGNADLLKSARLNKVRCDMQSQQNIDACVSAGTRGVGLMAMCDSAMPTGIIAVHPGTMPEGKAVGGRYPHGDKKETIPCRIVWATDVPKGSFKTNDKTCAACGLDFDTDRMWFVSVQKPWQQAWYDWALTLKVDTNDKGRAQSNVQVHDVAQMIYIISHTNIGMIANAISDLVALKGIKPEAVLVGKKFSMTIDQMLERLQYELRAGVDAAKKASVPDMDFVRMVRKFAKDEGINPNTVAFRPLSNGSIMSWRECTHVGVNEMLLGINLGDYIKPWELVSNETAIGRSFIELGPQLPTPDMEALENNNFTHYLADGEGEGAAVATADMHQYQAALQNLAAIEAEFPERAEEVADSRRDLLKAWSMRGTELMKDMPRVWLENYCRRLWEMSFNSKKSTQFFLWHSMPEVLLDLLEKANWIPARNRATVQGFIVGKEFVKHMGECETVSLRATLTSTKISTKGGTIKRQAIKIEGHEEVWLLSDGMDKIHRKEGDVFVIEVRRGHSAGRWPVTIMGTTREQANALRRMDRVLQKSA